MMNEMKEVNEIRAEKIARNANPLAFVAAAQQYLDTYHQAPKSHKSYAPTSKQSSFTISHTTTRHKGKEIAKPNTPPSESTSKEDSDLEQAQKDKDMQKNLHSVQMTVDGARETVRSQVVQQTRIQYFNYKEFKHFAKECRKPKRAKDYTYHKDKMLLCKQAEKGIPLQEVLPADLESDAEPLERFLDADYARRKDTFKSTSGGAQFLGEKLNGVVKRRNRTLVEAARTMLATSKLPLFFRAEIITTACYTQNRYLIIPRHKKTPYHIINGRKPSLKHIHIFSCTCYITRDGENLDKMKEKRDSCILVGYYTTSKGYGVYNKRTRLIVEYIHINFVEIKKLLETYVDNNTLGLAPQRQKASDYDNFDPAPQLQDF
nr:hypothetical protein [Tanacetum cinerariifolium]